MGSPAADAPRAPAFPVGLIALVLAIALALAASWGEQVWARRVTSRYVEALAVPRLPGKSQGLVMQEGALATGHTLPLYGSSELYCCGRPYRATDLFTGAPTGFDAFAAGRNGTADLFFMQTFAALGHALRGKKILVSISPTWFFQRHGLAADAYDANFSPEIAYAFAFEAPISLAVREAGARRMLDYPDTLSDQPLLRAALEDLANPTLFHLARYFVLAPLGRLYALALRVQDAVLAIRFIDKHHWIKPDGRPRPEHLDWVGLAKRGTAIAERRDTTNDFGFPNAMYRRQLRHGKLDPDVIARRRSGVSNRDGSLLPAPTAWEGEMSSSAEWTDLELELRVLREVGALPIVIVPPLAGVWEDYTQLSAPERDKFYDHFDRVVEQSKVPWIDLRAYDEDGYFVTDPGAHYSSRGWIFVDRALDMFWHGESIDSIRAALATLAEEVPAPAVAPATRPRR
ncbi:MAG TPA: D-alanyl-lipoteichoic acid biosynthesis protein DltD [Candidatus Binatia bacterium]|nr:D-alanyl-lipoteichoic acid biosynthesis protein DltD [Candidatus Binatia bacterium]